MCALQIIELQYKNVLHLQLEEFTKIIAKDELAQRSLVVISIAGAMRKGKSFLLNFLLTYAYNKFPTIRTIEKPKTLGNGPLIDGFSHCGGSMRHTTGIQVWPDIFLHDYSNGKKVAILFMDTQGTFDYATKFSDCVSIFALSTLLSSVQIYNISHNIQSDHLQYLLLFVEYAKLALNKILPATNNAPPFDKLQILVRDWNYSYQAEYGLIGGKTIIDDKISSSSAEGNTSVLNINDMFKSIECFLMPYPGDTIATAVKFDGRIETIDNTFLEQVAVLTSHLLSPENLQIKTINGVELTVDNFVNFIKQGFEILSKFENIPKPKTIVAATASSQSLKLIANAVDLYRKSMSKHLATQKYLHITEFIRLHKDYLNKSMIFYDNSDKVEFFDSETIEDWKTYLEELLTHEYNFFLIVNEKNKPNTSEPLQILINVITEQNNIIQELNERHTQDMLNILNTFRQNEQEHREHMHELTRRFQQSPKDGFNYMELLLKLIDIVPHMIQLLGLQRTGLGMIAITGCSVGRAILNNSNNKIKM